MEAAEGRPGVWGSGRSGEPVLIVRRVGMRIGARETAPGSEDNIEENLALMLTEPEQFQRTRGWLDAKAANGSAS